VTRSPLFRLGVPLALLAITAAGCLEAPEIEDRWTRVDLDRSNVANGAALAAGVADSIHVETRITYRRIVTGFLVAELRASSTVTPAMVTLAADAEREPMGRDIDAILASSVSVGRAVRAVTGWDHLIQPVTLDFLAVPAATVDSAGVSLGATSGLFLLCYLGSGERIERPGQSDSIAITPFLSGPSEILPVGLELGVAP
jgi:hypothetical protein